MVDFIRPTPRNRFVGLLADAASRARDATGIFGDFLLGGAPETLDNLSYGVSPVQFGDTSNGIMGAINGMRVDPGIADLTGIFGAVPAVGKLGRAAGMEALSAVNEGMMGSGIMSGLLSPVAPRFAVAPGKATSRAQRMQDMGLEVAGIGAVRSRREGGARARGTPKTGQTPKTTPEDLVTTLTCESTPCPKGTIWRHLAVTRASWRTMLPAFWKTRTTENPAFILRASFVRLGQMRALVAACYGRLWNLSLGTTAPLR